MPGMKPIGIRHRHHTANSVSATTPRRLPRRRREAGNLGTAAICVMCGMDKALANQCSWRACISTPWPQRSCRHADDATRGSRYASRAACCSGFCPALAVPMTWVMGPSESGARAPAVGHGRYRSVPVPCRVAAVYPAEHCGREGRALGYTGLPNHAIPPLCPRSCRCPEKPLPPVRGPP